MSSYSDPVIIKLCESIGRMRALTADESAVLEKAVRRQSRLAGRHNRAWTTADQLMLDKMLRKRIKATEIAIMLDRTPWSVRNRIKRTRGK